MRRAPLAIMGHCRGGLEQVKQMFLKGKFVQVAGWQWETLKTFPAQHGLDAGQQIGNAKRLLQKGGFLATWWPARVLRAAHENDG